MNESALGALFRPRSIAIIGMTERVSYSSRVYRELTAKNFEGEVYFVNPGRPEVYGKRCYPSLAAIGADVDMALVSVSAGQLTPVIAECIRNKVKIAVVYSSGVEDAEIEQIKCLITNDGQMRLLGPNTLGFVMPAHQHGIAHLLPLQLDAGSAGGHAALLMQSGGLGSVAGVELARRNGGVRYFIDTGNELDVSIADCIEYLIDDAQITVIGAFIEAVRDMPKFLRAARRALDKGKHLAVLKVGRSQRGAAATLLHTGSLAGDARLYEAIFAQHGILMCHEIQELVDVVQAAAFDSFRGRRRSRLSVAPAVRAR